MAAVIWIDGQTFEVDPSKNLLEVCLALGFNLPYFCWHPALGSVGACRQCAVKQFKNEQDHHGRIVMACMTPVTEGMRVSIDDLEAKAFRAQVIEWLMVNHPHDCPVCDEGGECHLQDMTVMTGHDYRRYRFKKRTYRNQDLGPLLNHEMNRCIQCYRCVRFYTEYAGGRDLQVMAAHDHVYFGRQEDGVLKSEFSGNLVEVCPTGVFTDKTLGRHYTRKWDLHTAPSVCVHCGLGCNTIPGERYGKLRRIHTRYHGMVNGYFLCDRGRYGYEFVNHERRLRFPLFRQGEKQPAAESIDSTRALAHLSALITASGRVVGIGSPRASIESNYMLRNLVRPERFYQGIAASEAKLLATTLRILQHGPSRTPSLREVQQCDAVLILGEDITNTAPLLDLAVRQAVRQQPLREISQWGIAPWNDAAAREAIQDQRGPLFLCMASATKLDPLARSIYRGIPEEIAHFGMAMARVLEGDLSSLVGLPARDQILAHDIAQSLQQAKRPLVIAGMSYAYEPILQAAARIAWTVGHSRAQGPAEIMLVVPECNSLGLALLSEQNLDDIFRLAEDGRIETAIILENDLYRRVDHIAVEQFFSRVPHIITLDSFAHPTTACSELLLPASTFAESNGTLINNEGRAQRFYQVFVPEAEIASSWQWLQFVAEQSRREDLASLKQLDQIIQSAAQEIPSLAGIVQAAPPAGFRVAQSKIARATHRFSGRTAIVANKTVHEPRPPMDPDTPFAFSMEGYHGEVPSALIPRFWSPGWNSIQAVNRFQEEIAGPLRGGDPGVRLFEPTLELRNEFKIPDDFLDDFPNDSVAESIKPTGRWRLIPLYHIFGSEELSAFSPPLNALAPQPYVILNPDDARTLGFSPGDELKFTLHDQTFRLPIRLQAEFPRKAVGLPVGIIGVPLSAWPGWHSWETA